MKNHSHTLSAETLERLLNDKISKEELLASIITENADFVIKAKLGRPFVASIKAVQLIPMGAWYDVEYKGAFPIYDLSDVGLADVVRIGRGPSNDFIIPDTKVSRYHGLIVWYKNKMHFIDYTSLLGEERSGSKNGTWLNDRIEVKDCARIWGQSEYLGFGGYLYNSQKDIILNRDYMPIRKNRIRYKIK